MVEQPELFVGRLYNDSLYVPSRSIAQTPGGVSLVNPKDYLHTI